MNQNNNIYSVRQVNSYIKRTLDSDFILKDIFVRGEISNCKYHSSGHIYFSLKDESGVLGAVMFASNAARLRFRLEDGAKVVVRGNVTVYERDGRCQLYARNIEAEGEGDLYRRFEELKTRLAEAGMFAQDYKRPIPPFSMRIGVVTAETGAVIRDIYNVASRRNPYCQIILYPAQVQGEGAAATICAGLAALDRMDLDVIIVGRGGGSIEDLWAFNEESVARAIFNSKTPVISAVGHETDFTIADFVADLRAPTPSAAAELAVFDYSQFCQDLLNKKYALGLHMKSVLDSYRSRVKQYSLTVDNLSPRSRLMQKAQYLQDLSNQLEALMDKKLRFSKEQLGIKSERLEGLSPLSRLSAGFAYITDGDGKAVNSIRDAEVGETISINMKDGVLDAGITSKREVKYE